MTTPELRELAGRLPNLDAFPSLAAVVSAQANASVPPLALPEPSPADAPTPPAPTPPAPDASALFQRAIAAVASLADRLDALEKDHVALANRAADADLAPRVADLETRSGEITALMNQYSRAFTLLDQRISGVAAELLENDRKDKSSVEQKIADLAKALAPVAGGAIGGVGGALLDVAVHRAIEALEHRVGRIAKRIGDL